MNRDGACKYVQIRILSRIAFEIVCWSILLMVKIHIYKHRPRYTANDLLIAAIVKFHDGILVTNNLKEFARIKGLKIENWVN